MSGSSSDGTSAGACCMGVGATCVGVLPAWQATGSSAILVEATASVEAIASVALLRDELLLRVGVPSRISLNEDVSDMFSAIPIERPFELHTRSAQTIIIGRIGAF